ncbi:MAG: hypothetical protein ACREBW_07880, partial [Candidatus Micrarchaeaceae archaeon]
CYGSVADGSQAPNHKPGEVDVEEFFPNQQMPASYAFATNYVRKGQYLFVDTNSLVQPTPSNVGVVWSVIARDQLANVDPKLTANGNPNLDLGCQPLTPGSSSYYCGNNAYYGTNISSGSKATFVGNSNTAEACPMEAFQMRIGCPAAANPCADFGPPPPGYW